MEANAGRHNSDPRSEVRLLRGATYKDCSTLCVVPTRDGKIAIKVEDAIDALIRPMNHPFYRFNTIGFEVGDAYNTAIQGFLANPTLAACKFLLTLESDNLPPPDGLTRLITDMYEGPWAAVSGLYWVKGEAGQPMIYGSPADFPVNFRPQIPVPGTVQECRGIGMGFALWDMQLFKDERLGPPWFVTKQDYDQAKGVELGTQDLTFCAKAVPLGYRFAVDTRIAVGHLEFSTGIVW